MVEWYYILIVLLGFWNVWLTFEIYFGSSKKKSIIHRLRNIEYGCRWLTDEVTELKKRDIK